MAGQARRVPLVVSIALALTTAIAGWLAHDLTSPELEAPDCVARQPVQEELSVGAGAHRREVWRAQTRINECAVELSSLQAQLAAVRLDAEGCHADEIPWREDIGEEWRANGFGDAVASALKKLEIEGDIALHCDEFPCIALLPDSADRFAVKEILTEQYEDADVWVKGHGMVGPWGKRSLRFIAAIPEGADSELLHERVYDRTQDITQAIEKELRQEVRRSEGGSPRPPPPPPPPEGDTNSVSEYEHVEK